MRDGLLAPSAPSASAASRPAKDSTGILPLAGLGERWPEKDSALSCGLGHPGSAEPWAAQVGHRHRRSGDGSVCPGSTQELPVDAELLVDSWIKLLVVSWIKLLVVSWIKFLVVSWMKLLVVSWIFPILGRPGEVEQNLLSV